ncbi:MAG: ABC transporter permease [Desulfobulbales bacterium]|nr:ABC transporter permease [Desulfobulbales bacterium]
MIRKLIATLIKDILLLWRDRAGLLLLFVMPAVLVVIITLVQDNVYKLMGETSARIILVDLDRDELGSLLSKRLSGMELVTAIDGAEVTEERGRELAASGDYQAAIVIREETTRRLRAGVLAEVRNSLLGDGDGDGAGAAPVPELEILFDPTVMGGFRSSLRNGLALVLMEFEIEAKMAALSRLLPEYIEEELKKSAGDFAEYVEVPAFAIEIPAEPLLTVRSGSASIGGALAAVPTPTQHNVPAWALFGMFFIVVPMAGSLIRERQEETLTRLRSMPVAYSAVLAGKVMSFVLVCFAQFGLIYLLGRFLLPALGIEPFRLGPQWGGALPVVAAASLAAAGYGILLGTICRTYEQASMFGSISVVAASAIGGVMVPVYAMPEIMQKISVISPLGWGLEAFLDIFVRGGGLAAATGEVVLLLSFALLTVLGAWLVFTRRAP